MNSLLAFFIFIPVCFFAFTSPGIYILNLSKFKFTQTENIIFGTVVGFVVFTIISYLLLLLNISILILPTYLLLNIYSFKKLIAVLKNLETNSKKKLIIFSFVFGLGILGQLAIISPSGITDRGGNILFWSSHAHDGTWHMALMESIKQGWPFKNPALAGEQLINYHYFSDIAPAIFSKYLPLTNLDIYFRLFPFIYTILLGSTAYLLVKKITGNFAASIWATFFTYFAGSFGFVVTYLKNRSLGGESLFWATQVQSSSGNSPQIISDILVLTCLYFAYLLFQKKNKVFYLIIGMIMGILVMFKVYGAIVLLTATSLVGIRQLIRDRSIYILSLSFMGFGLAAFLYYPNIQVSSSFLIFEPWWFIRTMIVEPSRLDWLDLEYRRQTYIYENNLKRVIYLESIGFLIFFFGNLGMRFLGLWDLVKVSIKSLKDNFYLLFALIILISLVFPLLFLQKGVAPNTSQFLQYFLLLFGLLAGISTSKFLKALRLTPSKIVAASLIILFSIPTQVGLLFEFYNRGAYAMISKDEVTALDWIKNNIGNDAIILNPPYDPELNLRDKIPHVWDWSDTAYVSALTGRTTYFEDQEQVDIMGYDWGGRAETKKIIFKTADVDVFSQKLKNSRSNILYFPKILKPKIDPSLAGLKRIFENNEVEIWKISP